MEDVASIQILVQGSLLHITRAAHEMSPLREGRAWSLAPRACTAVLLPLLSGQTVHKPAPLCDFLRITIYGYMLRCVIRHDSYTSSMYASIYVPSGLRENGRSRCANLHCNPDVIKVSSALDSTPSVMQELEREHTHAQGTMNSGRHLST